jgi:hypothetical protein
MKVDITQMLEFFDALTPLSDETKGIYWFESRIDTGLLLSFVFSLYEDHVSVIIKSTSQKDLTSVSMKNCSAINVLDEKKKCLEVIHENGRGRCFISLLEGTVLAYEE